MSAAVLVAMHTGPRSMLASVLAPHCRLRVKYAEDGEPLRPGTVYIAPALKHVVVNADRTMSVVERDRVRFGSALGRLVVQFTRGVVR